MKLTLDQALKKGIEAHKAGQVTEADRYYTAILKAQPKHPDANHNMGVLAIGMGKVQESLPFLKTALEANPNIDRFWLSYINALMKLNRVADAKAVFDQAKSKSIKGDGFEQIEKSLIGLEKSTEVSATSKKSQDPPQEQLKNLVNLYTQGKSQEALTQASQLQKQFPNSINLYNIIGATNQSLGKLDEAIEAYKKAISIKPNYVNVYNNMGNALQEQGKLKEAIEVYNKALSMRPDYAEAHYNMGNALKEQGKLEKAIKAYNKALSIKPDYAGAYNNIGNVLKEQGKLKEAIEAYNKALSIKPDYAEAHYNMGNALKEQGKLKEAIEAYNKALSIKPDYAEAYYNMGNALKEQGKMEAAIETYNKALSIKPDYAEVYNNIGITLREQGKLKEAIETYNKALSIKPDFTEVLKNMGSTLQECGRLEEALLAFKKVTSLEPDNSASYFNIGIILKKLGNPEGAINAYNKVICLNPNNAEAFNNLGNILKMRGKKNEAIELYKKALAINPDYGNAKHMISALTGKTTDNSPLDFVEGLFDNYAENFENALAEGLKYKIPKLIASLLVNKNGNSSLGSILDLGCGTGLLGFEVKNFCSNLVGIDLSHKMLEQAKLKKIYNKLTKSEILEYLSNEELNFDYFIASDVFIYVGKLSGVFRLIKSKNKKTGKLVFTTEHSEKDGFHLNESGRYSHSKSYIESLCKKFSYEMCHFSLAKLRKEKGVFLTGGIYILEF